MRYPFLQTTKNLVHVETKTILSKITIRKVLHYLYLKQDFFKLKCFHGKEGGGPLLAVLEWITSGVDHIMAVPE